MYPILKDYLLPITDQTLPTLIQDLESRGATREYAGGLGGRILVVLQDQQTRRARPLASMLYRLAGRRRSKTRRPFTAASDKIGAYPAADAVRPDDLAATLYYCWNRSTYGRSPTLSIDPYPSLGATPLPRYWLETKARKHHETHESHESHESHEKRPIQIKVIDAPDQPSNSLMNNILKRGNCHPR